MEKILTIVIPTYNMQDYLRRCLDSLIVPEEQMKQLEGKCSVNAVLCA